jgi:hypothetical protein
MKRYDTYATKHHANSNAKHLRLAISSNMREYPLQFDNQTPFFLAHFILDSRKLERIDGMTRDMTVQKILLIDMTTKELLRSTLNTKGHATTRLALLHHIHRLVILFNRRTIISPKTHSSRVHLAERVNGLLPGRLVDPDSRNWRPNTNAPLHDIHPQDNRVPRPEDLDDFQDAGEDGASRSFLPLELEEFLLVGGEFVEEVVDDLCGEDCDALFLGEGLGVFIDGDVEAEEDGEFGGTFNHACTAHDILLMHWANVDSRNLTISRHLTKI